MKTGRPKLKLAVEPELLNEVRRLYRETTDCRTKERAHSILLAAGGEHTYQEIADLLGRSKTAIQDWISKFQSDAIESFYTRQGRGGGRPSPLSDAEIQEAIKVELEFTRPFAI